VTLGIDVGMGEAMEIRLLGTGGRDGWPQPGCRCASCARARSSGRHRNRAEVVVDGVLRLTPGEPPARVPSQETAAQETGAQETGAHAAGTRETGAGEAGGRPGGHRVEEVAGGWSVTGPDGARLLVADGSGAVLYPAPGPAQPAPGPPQPDPGPPVAAGPYDAVLLDLLEDPALLGALRRRGLVGVRTAVAVLYADHRVPSEEELGQRCRFWGAAVPADGDVLTATPSASRPGASPADAGASQPGAGAPELAPPQRVLVLGGARSGKSRHAELRLAAEPEVTYLASGPYPAGFQPGEDSDWAERVAAHRARRPSWWRTVESVDAADVLRKESGVVLFDGAGTWLAAMLDESATEWSIAAKVDELIDAWRQTRARVVAVSDEVGLSVHPETRAGRVFRDQLGWLNQRLAAESEQTVLMIAGRPVELSSRPLT
jgi:adenosylcobinamide kinase/adenosylcobinamide-phosphate guanylyltransferase